jgi:hypothetical protein
MTGEIYHVFADGPRVARMSASEMRDHVATRISAALDVCYLENIATASVRSASTTELVCT